MLVTLCATQSWSTVYPQVDTFGRAAWNAGGGIAAVGGISAVRLAHDGGASNRSLLAGLPPPAKAVVEEAIKDRELDVATWRIPGGESVGDLRSRVEAFLQLLLAKSQEKKYKEDLKVLVVTHFMWMHELYRILMSIVGGERQEKPRTPNTGLDKYTLTARIGEDGIAKLEQVVCDVISCGKHLTKG